ncbi:MAG: peptide chain release factor-like protein [Candidatus Omnitrophica bacterium]|nr:peptide chain release factor-like protein [Candidatus Omnitrophota bacterium]
MANSLISRDRQARLQEQMLSQGIRGKDIVEKFIRSSGPGGQNVNRVSTCVYLKHIPTGIEVKCQRERTQAQNRYLARRILLEKIKDLSRRERLNQKQKEEKLRRQKRKRPRRVKIKILEGKRRHSQKKQSRQKISFIE